MTVYGKILKAENTIFINYAFTNEHAQKKSVETLYKNQLKSPAKATFIVFAPFTVYLKCKI